VNTSARKATPKRARAVAADQSDDEESSKAQPKSKTKAKASSSKVAVAGAAEEDATNDDEVLRLKLLAYERNMVTVHHTLPHSSASASASSSSSRRGDGDGDGDDSGDDSKASALAHALPCPAFIKKCHAASIVNKNAARGKKRFLFVLPGRYDLHWCVCFCFFLPFFCFAFSFCVQSCFVELLV
jgi:hypothetical protein